MTKKRAARPEETGNEVRQPSEEDGEAEVTYPQILYHS